MDAANRRLVATVPPAERKLVTNHDAFDYLAAHYGIRVVGSVIPALSTAAQPSAQDIADLIDRIRAEHVRAVFTESSLDPALERQIASEAGVRVYANLYGDTPRPAGLTRRDLSRDGALERARHGGGLPRRAAAEGMKHRCLMPMFQPG